MPHSRLQDRLSIRFNAGPVTLLPFLHVGIKFSFAITVPAAIINVITCPNLAFFSNFEAPLASTASRNSTAPHLIGACFLLPSWQLVRTHQVNDLCCTRSLLHPSKSRAAYPHLQVCSGAKLVAPRRCPWAHVWRSSIRKATPFPTFRRRFNTAALTLRGPRIRFSRPPKSAALVRHFYRSVARATRRFPFVSPMELIHVIASVRSLIVLRRSLYLAVSLSFDIVSYGAVTVVVI